MENTSLRVHYVAVWLFFFPSRLPGSDIILNIQLKWHLRLYSLRMAIFFLSCQPNCSIISICLETVLIIHFSFLFGKRHLWFSQPNKYNWEARSFHVIFMEFETPGVDIKTDLLQGIRMIIFSVFSIGWLKWKHVYCIQERNPTVACKTTPRTIFGSSMQTQDVSFASLWLVFCWNALSPRDQYKTNKKKKESSTRKSSEATAWIYVQMLVSGVSTHSRISCSRG